MKLYVTDEIAMSLKAAVFSWSLVTISLSINGGKTLNLQGHITSMRMAPVSWGKEIFWEIEFKPKE